MTPHLDGHPRTMEIPRRAPLCPPDVAVTPAREPDGLRRLDMPTTREMPSLTLVPLSVPVPTRRGWWCRRPLLALAAILPAVALLGWIVGGGGW